MSALGKCVSKSKVGRCSVSVFEGVSGFTAVVIDPFNSKYSKVFKTEQGADSWGIQTALDINEDLEQTDIMDSSNLSVHKSYDSTLLSDLDLYLEGIVSICNKHPEMSDIENPYTGNNLLDDCLVFVDSMEDIFDSLDYDFQSERDTRCAYLKMDYDSALDNIDAFFGNSLDNDPLWSSFPDYIHNSSNSGIINLVSNLYNILSDAYANII